MNWIDEEMKKFDAWCVKNTALAEDGKEIEAYEAHKKYLFTALQEAYQRGVEEGSKCRVCGGTDVVCAQGVADQIKKAVEEERKRVLEWAQERIKENKIAEEDCSGALTVSATLFGDTNAMHDLINFINKS